MKLHLYDDCAILYVEFSDAPVARTESLTRRGKWRQRTGARDGGTGVAVGVGVHVGVSLLVGVNVWVGVAVEVSAPNVGVDGGSSVGSMTGVAVGSSPLFPNWPMRDLMACLHKMAIPRATERAAAAGCCRHSHETAAARTPTVHVATTS
jgi:hypothetical protein